MVDATRATVDNEAELVAASARFSCPLASSYLAVSVQDLMAADRLGTPATDWRQRWAQLQRDLRSLRRRSSGGLTSLKVTRKRDLLFTFLVDAYHLKDLLKDASGSTGIPKQAVENAVTNDVSLALLADLVLWTVISITYRCDLRQLPGSQAFRRASS